MMYRYVSSRHGNLEGKIFGIATVEDTDLLDDTQTFVIFSGTRGKFRFRIKRGYDFFSEIQKKRRTGFLLTHEDNFLDVYPGFTEELEQAVVMLTLQGK